MFGGVLDETVQSVHACDEDIEILKNFTYLGSVLHNDGGSSQEVTKRTVLKGGKATGICDIIAVLLKAGDGAIICGLHSV